MKKRKMLTKTLCVVLSAVLLASGLTGCGGGGGEAAGTGEQTQKDTLIIAKSEDVTSLDPSEASGALSPGPAVPGVVQPGVGVRRDAIKFHIKFTILVFPIE